MTCINEVRAVAGRSPPIQWGMRNPPAPPQHLTSLLRALVEPSTVLGLDGDGWDLLVRTAGASELLGTLHGRLDRAGVLGAVPEGPLRHLGGAHSFYLHRAQMARYLLRGLAQALHGFEGKLVLLKGAAYVVQALPFAVGRLFDDVDLLVSRADLDEVEGRLQQAGWLSEKPDAYDQHYYRAWAHELPPMRHPRYLLQLDVHHTILPVTGRLKPDPVRLLDTAVPVAGGCWQALSPADQLLHVAVHLFQDSDCIGRLRELVDFDALLRTHAGPHFDHALAEHAEIHGVGRPLWYAMRYAQAWLDTTVSPALAHAISKFAPNATTCQIMDALVGGALFSTHPDGRPPRHPPFANRLLMGRAVWLRMPPTLLAYHALRKAVRAWRHRPDREEPLA